MLALGICLPSSVFIVYNYENLFPRGSSISCEPRIFFYEADVTSLNPFSPYPYVDMSKKKKKKTMKTYNSSVRCKSNYLSRPIPIILSHHNYYYYFLFMNIPHHFHKHTHNRNIKYDMTPAKPHFHPSLS
jgi:hypothetical protein